MVKKFRWEIDDIENQLRESSEGPDLYNQHFCSSGWVAHESLSFKKMLSAIRFAKQGRIEKGEKVLLSHYTPKNLRFMLIRFRNIEPFSKRTNLIEQAIKDYKSKRFSSCVLHLLITIDGVVNDIENTGFFANNINLLAWDSIAGHSSSLKKLKKLFCKSRKDTNTKEIFIPYRNGILHGRDIKFNNKYVAAKCWSALIAVYDWAMALEDKGHTAPEKEPVPRPIKTIIDFAQALRNKDIDFPRELEIGKDVPKWGTQEQYELNSPERKAVEFISYWQERQWDRIIPLLQPYPSKFHGFSKKEKKQLKFIINITFPQPIRILKIDDQTLNTTEVHVLVNFASSIWQGERVIPLKLIYKNNDGTPLIRGDEAGNWFLIVESIIPIDRNKK